MKILRLENLDFVTETNGKGYWSSKAKKDIIVNSIVIEPYANNGFIYFSNWDTSKDGLIYTDDLWMQTLRENLMRSGFTSKAVYDIDYSEQGLQGDSFVNIDFGNVFRKEFIACIKEINKALSE